MMITYRYRCSCKQIVSLVIVFKSDRHCKFVSNQPLWKIAITDQGIRNQDNISQTDLDPDSGFQSVLVNADQICGT